jgi:hypothetical protein
MSNIIHRLWHHPLSNCNVEQKESSCTVPIHSLDFPCSNETSQVKCLHNRCIAIGNLNRYLLKPLLEKRRLERLEKSRTDPMQFEI